MFFKAVVFVFALLLSACANKISFQPQPNGTLVEGTTKEFVFPMSQASEYFKQENYGVNETSIVFQALDAKNNTVKGLKEDDVIVAENGVRLTNYKLAGSDKTSGRKADIVFVLDVTGSMQPYIDAVKDEVRQFVRDLETQKIQASLCLVTFQDEVERRCDRFIEDDPRTSKNENLETFIRDVDALRAGNGGDTPENQLKALQVASESPWHADAQRLAVLLTDAEFHYAPDFLGGAPDAPEYSAALTTLVDNQTQVFAVAPDFKGYSKEFVHSGKRYPSLSDATGGEWYDFAAIRNRTGELKKIFNAIVDRVTTTYTLTYTSEDNPGVDPTLELARRLIHIVDANPARALKISVHSVASTQPNGKPHYKKEFNLKAAANSKKVSVMVDGVLLTKGYKIKKNKIEFEKAPGPLSEIRVYYYSEKLKDNFEVSAIKLGLTDDKTIQVKINGLVLSAADYDLNRLDSKNVELSLRDEVFSESDPYGLLERQELRLELVVGKK